MTLLKWIDPAKRVESRNMLMPTMETLFNGFFNNDLVSRDYAGYVPSVNITEKEDKYCIEVSAPGFDKSDFNVVVEDGLLKISGEHRSENETDETSFVRKEFNYGSFTRQFNLKDVVDIDNIVAKYENGILRLELAKNEKLMAKNVKQIEIA
ncbi:MAG: Hsp20/alpha crystallin family protein [Bacteroidia bacterium]|jgi:HSP20 family protein|uniref:Hsp20/alpha crystallin family protein n=1 Tax=Candidatus Brachybacter algidus TaxID=2982024 RepID=UPI001B3FBBAC|nr:Hsp20/alpha crystallin family protein [Candidatus Brachybacter algidus]MBP9922337.1 Hsp20/alpha crystallin family protein [Bacteroidia bacterium]MBK6450343.1 Hsp20/alpha crystallin family protein [Candidatus Brachybacter algidus]MBK7605102.1 Hsp20/alpha crystallin family protein [Candidatus Brachybacter algidus]MBK9396903.1 Hsp20/alpha crystallin family protein [Candidatus Brachybacter algidus]MBL0120546.1 Hsp20/alpha crystallin family protein [Candidatus Brachybacter algidus]